MTKNLEQYREWLKQELVEAKNLAIKAEQGIICFNKALFELEKEDNKVRTSKSEVVSEDKPTTTSSVTQTENTKAAPSITNYELRTTNSSDRTPAQMIASKYKEYSIPSAIEVYLNTLNGESTTVDEIELELFDLQDGDSDVERKKVRATLSTVLSTGMAKKKFTKVSKGNWSLYKEIETIKNEESIALNIADSDVASFIVEENTSFLEEDLVSTATANSKHH